MIFNNDKNIGYFLGIEKVVTNIAICRINKNDHHSLTWRRHNQFLGSGDNGLVHQNYFVTATLLNDS